METSTRTYIENFNSCNLSISNIGAAATTTKYSDHPKIKSSQAKYVKAKGYKIIMWDVLSADFDQNITKESV
jgi:hypothetical protein